MHRCRNSFPEHVVPHVVDFWKASMFANHGARVWVFTQSQWAGALLLGDRVITGRNQSRDVARNARLTSWEVTRVQYFR